MYWTTLRVQQEGSGGIGCGAAITWHGKRGLNLGETMAFLLYFFLGFDTVTYITSRGDK